MTRYVLRRKADGLFLQRGAHWQKSWTDNMAKVRIFTQKGHAMNAVGCYVRLPYPPVVDSRTEQDKLWKQHRKDQAKARKELFQSLYEVLGVSVEVQKWSTPSMT